MDMSCCSSLRELPNLFVELGNLRELNLCDCISLEKLPKGFTQLKYLVKLNLSKCSALKELCNEFHCLLSLETLVLWSIATILTPIAVRITSAFLVYNIKARARCS